MADRYQYNIDEKAKQTLIDELNEDSNQVNAHVESLRRWVKSMPHIQCPTDAKFLLRFLRTSKFDHIKAQKRIDNFCTMRTSERGVSHHFKLYNVNHSLVETFLKMKFFLPLGKIDSGETIILVRYDDWDPDNLPLIYLIHMFYMNLDAVLEDEDSQIFGIKYIFNFYGVNKKVIETLCDSKLLRSAYTSFQDSYPLRMKGQIFLSNSTLFDVFFKMVLFFLNDKFKKRTLSLRHDITKLIEMAPELDKILPKEYNGHGGTLDECAERWSVKFRNFYKDGHPFQSISVDESKRPKETLAFLAKHADYKEESLQNEGTYTKFEDVF